jgi:CBS domain-containing protein
MAHLSGEPKSPSAEFKIAAVGPLTSFALGGGFWLIARAATAAGVDPLWTAVFRYLSFINVALAIFNLLPGFPLDGGRLLRAYFWSRSGSLREATARAANWGGGIAIGLMVLGAMQIFAGALVGGLWLILIAVFLRGAAQANYYGVVVEQALGRTPVADVMVREPVCVGPDVTVQDAIEEYFLRYGYSGFPVASGEGVVGVVSLSMMRTCPREERATRRVGEIMRPLDDAIRIAPRASVAEALRRMVDADTGRLVVIENGHMLGLITRTGVTRYVRAKTELEQEAAS